MLRKSNTECKICKKPLYRRPYEFKKSKEFCCKGCRSKLYKKRPIPKGLMLGWELSWKSHNNHRGGLKHTEETKRKIKEKNKLFHKNNPEVAIKRGKLKSKNSKHKTELNQLIRTYPFYKNWVKLVFERDNYTCQKCGVTKVYLQAHHKIPLSLILHKNNLNECNFENIQKALQLEELWDINNGQTLCLKCHKKEHKDKNIYVRRKKC